MSRWSKPFASAALLALMAACQSAPPRSAAASAAPGANPAPGAAGAGVAGKESAAGAAPVGGAAPPSSGAANGGIVQTAALTDSGAGNITLNGTGGGSGNNEGGYYTTANVTAGTGNIAITGAGSAAAAGSYNLGLNLAGGTALLWFLLPAGSDLGSGVALAFLGGLVAAVALALHFGRVRGGY